MFVPNVKYVRVEALNKITGKGDIIKLDFNLELVTKELVGRHYSYPQTIFFENDEFLFPEVASHSSPTLYKVKGEEFTPIKIKGTENERLIDCTLFKFNGIYYLFAGKKKSAEGVLYLFFAKGLFEKFYPHPQSPIVIDPYCARMAGPIFTIADKLYRIGQNNKVGYGASAVLCQIENLTEETYSECFLKEISLNSVKGPHTIMSLGRYTVFDFYEDKFSLLAGYRRFVGKFTR